MANFVLVHGAWHGGWCWLRVVQALSAAGHRVHAPTLTGLGERSHLMSSAITLETHIADVMGLIDAEELHDVILAVHSYAGMLGTAVADRMSGRLQRLVYVDAVVPRPGESWGSTHTGTTRAARIASAEGSPDYTFPAPDPTVFGLAGPDLDWVRRRQTPHPGHTYTAPLDFDPQRVGSVPRTFVNCTAPALATIDAIRTRVMDAGFWNGHWLPRADLVELKTGHDPMISAPAALCDVLVRAA